MIDGDLKPCPFCGATENSGMIGYCVVPIESFMLNKTLEYYSIGCSRCDCQIGNYKTKKEAIEAWNMRADMRGEEDED